MGRTFLMIRSVAFAFVTKISGGATVFIALPIISHGMSASDYATFLTTMNVTAAVGLVFVPFGALYIREMAHAFATEDPHLVETAIRHTFGAHAALTAIAAGVLALGVAAAASVIGLSGSLVAGLTFAMLQTASSWGQIYRIANRTDYVTSLVQTVSNIAVVACLVALAQTHRLSGFSVAAAYFGIPALGEAFIFLQLLAARQVEIHIDRGALAALRERIPESFPLYLSPVADYVKVYASSMLVLFAAGRHEYILFSTSVLLMARLVNPVTLITRPLMPAFIDAFHREDEAWLGGLRKALFAAAAFGAAVAAVLPLFVNDAMLALVLPKEAGDVSRAFVFFCSYFAYAYTLVALLAPLYIGVRRAPFYGVSNLAFTLAAALLGTLLGLRFGAPAMMGSLALLITVCGVFLLLSIRWTKESATQIKK